MPVLVRADLVRVVLEGQSHLTSAMVHLRTNQHLVTSLIAFQDAPQDALALAVGIDIAGVDEVDPGIHRRHQDLFTFRFRSGIHEVVGSERQG